MTHGKYWFNRGYHGANVVPGTFLASEPAKVMDFTDVAIN
jgi:hypothetical protein